MPLAQPGSHQGFSAQEVVQQNTREKDEQVTPVPQPSQILTTASTAKHHEPLAPPKYISPFDASGQRKRSPGATTETVQNVPHDPSVGHFPQDKEAPTLPSSCVETADKVAPTRNNEGAPLAHNTRGHTQDYQHKETPNSSAPGHFETPEKVAPPEHKEVVVPEVHNARGYVAEYQDDSGIEESVGTSSPLRDEFSTPSPERQPPPFNFNPKAIPPQLAAAASMAERLSTTSSRIEKHSSGSVGNETLVSIFSGTGVAKTNEKPGRSKPPWERATTSSAMPDPYGTFRDKMKSPNAQKETQKLFEDPSTMNVKKKDSEIPKKVNDQEINKNSGELPERYKRFNNLEKTPGTGSPNNEMMSPDNRRKVVKEAIWKSPKAGTKSKNSAHATSKAKSMDTGATTFNASQKFRYTMRGVKDTKTDSISPEKMLSPQGLEGRHTDRGTDRVQSSRTGKDGAEGPKMPVNLQGKQGAKNKTSSPKTDKAGAKPVHTEGAQAAHTDQSIKGHKSHVKQPEKPKGTMDYDMFESDIFSEPPKSPEPPTPPKQKSQSHKTPTSSKPSSKTSKRMNTMTSTTKPPESKKRKKTSVGDKSRYISSIYNTLVTLIRSRKQR